MGLASPIKQPLRAREQRALQPMNVQQQQQQQSTTKGFTRTTEMRNKNIPSGEFGSNITIQRRDKLLSQSPKGKYGGISYREYVPPPTFTQKAFKKLDKANLFVSKYIKPKPSKPGDFKNLDTSKLTAGDLVRMKRKAVMAGRITKPVKKALDTKVGLLTVAIGKKVTEKPITYGAAAALGFGISYGAAALGAVPALTSTVATTSSVGGTALGMAYVYDVKGKYEGSATEKQKADVIAESFLETASFAAGLKGGRAAAQATIPPVAETIGLRYKQYKYTGVPRVEKIPLEVKRSTYKYVPLKKSGELTFGKQGEITGRQSRLYPLDYVTSAKQSPTAKYKQSQLQKSKVGIIEPYQSSKPYKDLPLASKGGGKNYVVSGKGLKTNYPESFTEVGGESTYLKRPYPKQPPSKEMLYGSQPKGKTILKSAYQDVISKQQQVTLGKGMVEVEVPFQSPQKSLPKGKIDPFITPVNVYSGKAKKTGFEVPTSFKGRVKTKLGIRPGKSITLKPGVGGLSTQQLSPELERIPQVKSVFSGGEYYIKSPPSKIKGFVPGVTIPKQVIKVKSVFDLSYTKKQDVMTLNKLTPKLKQRSLLKPVVITDVGSLTIPKVGTLQILKSGTKQVQLPKTKTGLVLLPELQTKTVVKADTILKLPTTTRLKPPPEKKVPVIKIPTPRFFDPPDRKRRTRKAQPLPFKTKGYKGSYTPTLWGTLLPKIKATKGLASKAFTGIGIRPQVKFTTSKKKKKKKKKPKKRKKK